VYGVYDKALADLYDGRAPRTVFGKDWATIRRLVQAF